MTPLSSPSRRAALAQLAALTALAGLHVGCAATVVQPLLDLQLIDRDSGAALAQYPSQGRRYSPGAPGARYAIRLTNRTAARVLVVLSVDGVNAITGDTAAFEQVGYVLAPGERHDIAGWRKSDERIAAFEFTALGDAYATRTGRPGNVGVIGAAVFRELVLPPPVAATARSGAPLPAAPSLLRMEGADAAAAASAETAARSRLGTGHGAVEWSPISHTDFHRRTSHPEQLLEILYDSQANLMAAGIMPRPAPPAPRAFPGSVGRYVPDPPPRQ